MTVPAHSAYARVHALSRARVDAGAGAGAGGAAGLPLCRQPRRFRRQGRVLVLERRSRGDRPRGSKLRRAPVCPGRGTEPGAPLRCDRPMRREARTATSRLAAPTSPSTQASPSKRCGARAATRGIALQAAARAAKLGDPAAAVVTSVATASPPAIVAQAQPKSVPAPPPAEPADPRRSDTCVRFADTRSAPAGDATITNTCAYPIELTLCYKGGGGGPYDCPTAARGRFGDSLGPGISHVLPEYRRGRHKGINVVACRGAPGSVFPRLEDGGKSGCF